MSYVCQMCEDEPFIVPADEIGTAVMKQHLLTEHDVLTPETRLDHE